MPDINMLIYQCVCLYLQQAPCQQSAP